MCDVNRIRYYIFVVFLTYICTDTKDHYIDNKH